MNLFSVRLQMHYNVHIQSNSSTNIANSKQIESETVDNEV